MGYVEELREIVGNKSINLVASTVVVTNDKGEILLQERREPYGFWGLPGGLIELGESTENAAKREVHEETGLIIDNLNLIGVFSGEKEHFIELVNGDKYYVVLVAYYSKDFNGSLYVDKEESLCCKFFDVSNIPGKVLDRHIPIINKYLEIK